VEHLLRRGYEVVGAARQPQAAYRVAGEAFRYVSLDLRHADGLSKLLVTVRPRFIFHVAAVHGEAGSRYEPIWQDMLAVNVGATHVCLEYLRTRCPEGGLVYAGSCKTFGPVYPRVVTEKSRQTSPCLYSVTKNASRELIDVYRRDHGTRASVLHLFNHESERRAASFFVPTLVSALRGALADKRHRVEVASLRFYCDWGSAEEYMDIAVDVAERALGQDFILATGHTHTGESLAKELFARHGLDHRVHVIERRVPNEAARHFRASVDKLAKALGRRPVVSIVEVCEKILAAGNASANKG
jgi:GDPmannose 4,6-dehydratase